MKVEDMSEIWWTLSTLPDFSILARSGLPGKSSDLAVYLPSANPNPTTYTSLRHCAEPLKKHKRLQPSSTHLCSFSTARRHPDACKASFQELKSSISRAMQLRIQELAVWCYQIPTKGVLAFSTRELLLLAFLEPIDS